MLGSNLVAIPDSKLGGCPRKLGSMVSTLQKFNIAPETIPSRKESSLPTIMFRGYVKLGGCKWVATYIAKYQLAAFFFWICPPTRVYNFERLAGLCRPGVFFAEFFCALPRFLCFFEEKKSSHEKLSFFFVKVGRFTEGNMSLKVDSRLGVYYIIYSRLVDIGCSWVVYLEDHPGGCK